MRRHAVTTQVIGGWVNSDWVEPWSNYVRLPKELQNIRLLLDQRPEVEFELTPYANTRIQEYISSKFLVNPNIWHMNVPLVVYAMVEIHESDVVMW
ncbi:hypothetical protein J1N35_044714 [Gossypium stocksii]|uniref:Uncharacterized protein n=1 Tax=Gossypium stocksii TaxID=47602 RepID=A0A9D3ZG84_9ROSI|nr:hypothetical protein J1N35_044714 [Gossypium stocksii]